MITPIIEIIENYNSNQSSFRKYPQKYKYISTSGSKENSENPFKTRKNLGKDSDKILIQTNERVLCEEPLNNQLHKLTNVKRNLKFQKSAMGLNNKMKSSLYNKLTQRAMKRFKSAKSVKNIMGHRNFLNTQKSVQKLNFKKTKLSSLRNSVESWNPFRDNMMIRKSLKKDIKNFPTVTEKDIIKENVDVNMSGSDYDQDHVISNF